MGIFDGLKDIAKAVIPGAVAAASGGTWIGPAISAGASLLGQRQQNSYAQGQTAKNMRQQLQMQKRSQRISSRQQREDTKRQFKWIRKGAEQGGFNPLTALGHGVAGTQPTGQPLQTLSGGSPGAAALDSFANIMANYDPIATETARLSNELARAQLNNAKEKSERLGASVPQVRSTQSPVEARSEVDAAISNQKTLGTNANVEKADGGDPRQRSTYDAIAQDPRVLRRNPDGSIEPAELEVDAYGAALNNEIWPYLGSINLGNNPYFDGTLDRTVREWPNVWKTINDAHDATKARREERRELTSEAWQRRNEVFKKRHENLTNHAGW